MMFFFSPSVIFSKEFVSRENSEGLFHAKTNAKNYLKGTILLKLNLIKLAHVNKTVCLNLS